MRGKVAKEIRRAAEASTVGKSVRETRKKYQAMKKLYKAKKRSPK